MLDTQAGGDVKPALSLKLLHWSFKRGSLGAAAAHSWSAQHCSSARPAWFDMKPPARSAGSALAKSQAPSQALTRSLLSPGYGEIRKMRSEKACGLR